MRTANKEIWDQLPEEIWWKRFKAGDKEAFETIFRAYFKDLFNYGMTICREEYLVKDAIQDLFIDLWGYKDNLADPEQLRFYLLKSLRTKIYRHINTEKKFSDVALKSHFSTLIESLPSQETVMIDEQDLKNQKERMVLLINDLPPRQREVILLVFFEGRMYEEVSAILSMNVQSVYTLVWRAISSLRKKLESQN